MRNSFTREGGSTIFRTPSAESSLSYWRESSIFLQINQVTEECSISGVFNFSFNFAIHREHFPIPNWFRKHSALEFSMSDLKLILFPCHLFKLDPDLHGFPGPAERLPCCLSARSSSSSLTQWLVSSELLSESASSLHSQLPQIWSLSAFSIVWQQLPHRPPPHPSLHTQPSWAQDQPTHCFTAKQAPNPPTTPGFPKSSLKTFKWPSRQIKLHPTNNYPFQDSPFLFYKVTVLTKQC